MLTLIAHQHLFGLGLGYVDAYLFAATLLTTGSHLWARDTRLAAVHQGLTSDDSHGS